MVARVVSASQGGATRSATRSPLAWTSSLAFGDMLQRCRDRSAPTIWTPPLHQWRQHVRHRTDPKRRVLEDGQAFLMGSHVVETICSM
jgi:hypothetical protein